MRQHQDIVFPRRIHADSRNAVKIEGCARDDDAGKSQSLLIPSHSSPATHPCFPMNALAPSSGRGRRAKRGGVGFPPLWWRHISCSQPPPLRGTSFQRKEEAAEYGHRPSIYRALSAAPPFLISHFSFLIFTPPSRTHSFLVLSKPIVSPCPT